METTPVSTSSRTLKVRASKSADTTPRKAVTVKRKPKSIIKPASVDTTQLNGMIATAAYFIAQKRNFAPGSELHDWLVAEQQVLAMQSSNV